jgi:aerobic-type carbon monoxide dehydrogenase small subunit (CoxS/CutS family)
MLIKFVLNDNPQEIEISPKKSLLELLREDFGLFGVKHGCETGECGACTVLLNGEPVNSCVMLAAQSMAIRLRQSNRLASTLNPAGE